MKEARPREQAWHVDGAPSGASAQASKSRGEGTVDGWPASVACPQQSGDRGIKVANVVWVLKENWVGPQSSIFSCSCCCCVLGRLPEEASGPLVTAPAPMAGGAGAPWRCGCTSGGLRCSR